MSSFTPYHRTAHPTTLGESPLYRPSDSTLHWVDFFSSPPTLHVLQTTNHSIYHIIPLPHRVTCLYFHARKPHSYIVGYSRGIAYLTLSENDDYVAKFEVVKELIPAGDEKALTMNDGGVDPAGKFWVTAVDLETLSGTGGAGKLPKGKGVGSGKLWRFDGMEVVEMDKGVTVGNGMAWSVDGKRMYFNDSGTQKTYAYDFDVTDSSISNKRVLIDHTTLGLFSNVAEVMNDGMIIDASSNLWIAMWCGGCMLQFSPSGALLQRIDFSAKFLTCPVWGGEDGNTMFVTSATDKGKVSNAPEGDEGGQLFSWKGEGVKGVAKGEFGGKGMGSLL